MVKGDVNIQYTSIPAVWSDVGGTSPRHLIFVCLPVSKCSDRPGRSQCGGVVLFYQLTSQPRPETSGDSQGCQDNTGSTEEGWQYFQVGL